MTGFPADTSPSPNLANKNHLDGIKDLRWLGLYLHSLPVLSGFFGHIALETGGVMNPAATQAGTEPV